MGDKIISRRDFLSLGMALAGVAAFGGYAAAPRCAVADTRTFPGIRWYPVMGVYERATRGWTSNRTFFKTSTTSGLAQPGRTATLTWATATPSATGLRVDRRSNWRDCLVDENLAPTSHAQARNPNWSNYRWNRPDIFTEMLAGSSAASQDKAKLGLLSRLPHIGEEPRTDMAASRLAQARLDRQAGHGSRQVR